jgi:hypothetical protein
MTAEEEDEDLGITPTWWVATMNELLCRLWGIIRRSSGETEADGETD